MPGVIGTVPMSKMTKNKKIIRKPRPRPKAKPKKVKAKKASPQKRVKKQAKPAYIVLLDPSVCKGCQICIEVCPKGVFEKTDKISKRGHHIIKVARPSECIGCLECEVLCPDLAITVEKAG